MKLPLVRCCFALFALLSYSIAQAGTLDDTGKQLLTHPLATPAKQVDALQDYLDEAATEQTPASLVLKSHARLQLGALLLQQGDYEQSRAVLMALPQKSPVAVPAALLLAQTWLNQHKAHEAMQWYLRTAQRYPYHPQALEGLLDAVTLLQDIDMQGALALCDTATQNSTKAIDQLQQLQRLIKEHGLPALITPQAGIDPSIQRQLTETILLHAETNLFDNDSQARRFTLKYRQLLSQLHSLQQAQADTAVKMQQLYQAITLLQQRTAYAKQQIETMKKELSQTDNNSHMELRRRLVQVNNNSQIDQAQLRFMEQNRVALPTISAHLHKKLDALLRYAAEQQNLHAGLFTSSVQAGAKELNNHWHNTAAQGQLLKAEMLRAAVTH